MKLDFVNNVVENFTVVLSSRNKKKYGQIVNIQDFTYKANLNEPNEISFMVYKKLDNNYEQQWDNIKDLRLVWVKELDEYFQIEVSLCDSLENVKHITGTSLCEAELSQAQLFDIEINTETDIARDNYIVTKFYDALKPEASLLHRVLDKMPHYSIKHVDDSLCNLQRSFSINGTSIYDFFVGECSEQFNCLFQFDTTDRSISVYDLYTVCDACGHRGEYHNTCPKCGGKKLKYFGEDTLIYVDSENLTEEINYETDVDSIKNCFKLVAGDDDMTAAVITCNPNGSAYLYYFSEEQKADMPRELVEKLESYDALYNSYAAQYQTISEDIYNCIDQILYYRSSMMPDVTTAKVTAATEAAKLTANNLSPLGLTVLSNYTTVDTVNSALKNYARVFVKTGYVKIEVASGQFVFNGTSSSGEVTGKWTGNFKVTSYADKEDVAYSPTITVTVTNDYEEFLYQKIMKDISVDDENIYNVLSLSTLSLFKDALTSYSFNRLSSFADAIQGVLDILIEEKQSGTDSSYYSTFYEPYYNKLVACQQEMNVRSVTIKTYEDRYEELIEARQQIQAALNIQDYLGEDLYHTLCAYRREDTYQNDNYISDGLDNATIFKNAMDFIETAKKDIVKSGEYQHTITSDLDNLLIMDEFKPITDYFELGNWIRFRVDEDVYRLRLIGYEINFNSLQKINTTFSDLTKISGAVSDVQNIIQSAQSMATSYSYVQKQAEKGQESSSTVKNWMKDGLNSAVVNLKNNDKEEITYDNHGILCRAYDDITNSYSDKQLKLTHNVLAFTRDNWQTCSLALGEHNYYYYDSNKVLKQATGYGLTSDFVTSGYVTGSQIIGGEIYSQNYSSTAGTYMNLNNGTFSFAGGKIKYDGTNLLFKGVNISWADIADAPTKISAFTNDSGYQNASQVTTITKNTVTTEYVNALNITAQDIAATTLSGKTIKGGAIYSSNYSSTVGTYLNLNDGTFSFGGGKISYNGTTLALNGVSILWKDINDATTNVSAIAKSTINVSYLNALNIIAGSVAAENITGTTISGKTISGGTVTGATIEGSRFHVNADVGNAGDTYVNVRAGVNGDGKFYRTSITPQYIYVASEANNSMMRIGSWEIIGYDSSTSTREPKFYLYANGNAYFSGTLSTASGTVSKSDKDAKNSIELLDLNTSSDFIYSLKPSKFKYNNGTSGRFHHGFIAQEVKESMDNEDWGLYVDENPEEPGNKGLRYEELIADLVATVQTLNERIKILENKE